MAGTDTKEWTLMFYFGSDNPLAPGIVSQLKALKTAGYHQQANVIAYFDPETIGTPTHVFDVNAIYKLEDDKPNIGFTKNDPFVRNLMLDKLWGDKELNRDGIPIRELLIQQFAKYNLPKPPTNKQPTAKRRSKARSTRNTEPDPKTSLKTFLDFCASEYEAKHYMLFILGHGLIVGDDVFLFDEHAAKHSLTLRELREVLDGFKTNIKQKDENAEFELVSFHSCSMSGLEVAYELQDTANYMLASQGPAFVGSWPYTQILIRVFNDIKRLMAVDKQTKAGAKNKGAAAQKKGKVAAIVEAMIEKIFYYILHNSTDFMLAGYSFELCLCDLRKDKIRRIGGALKDLSAALVQGLQNSLVKNCVLLAHWQSQSYWGENYTDMYDFCFCLNRYCDDFGKATGDTAPFESIQGACDKVMESLAKRSHKQPDNPIILAEFAGPGSQYSHGLSVFFPWTRPTADRIIMEEYPQYKFDETGWFSRFLNQYWGPAEYPTSVVDRTAVSIDGSTMRLSHVDEQDPLTAQAQQNNRQSYKRRNSPFKADLLEDIISLMFDAQGPLSNDSTLDDPDPLKTNPRDPTGDDCTCGSIKNYPHDTRPRFQRSQRAETPCLVSQTFFRNS
jgi:Clostripain family